MFSFRINYVGTLKTVFTNKAFVIMFFVLGGNMSFISTLATKMEQIMCRFVHPYLNFKTLMYSYSP